MQEEKKKLHDATFQSENATFYSRSFCSSHRLFISPLWLYVCTTEAQENTCDCSLRFKGDQNYRFTHKQFAVF